MIGSLYLFIIDIFITLLRDYIEYFMIFINYLYLNPITNSIIKGVMFIAFTVWSVFLAYHIIGLIAYKKYKTLKSNNRAPAEIVIVTIGNRNVRDSLFDSIEYNKVYGDITILTEDNADMIEEIRYMNVNVIEVPREYRRDLVGKGRALNYFAEYIAEDDKWYIFLDDDNFLLDDNIFYEIHTYESLDYVAANPILVPRKSSSKITYVMDWMRYFDDQLTFKAFTGLFAKPLIGMHGEMFTIKGKILKEIGFNKRTLTEDFRFSCELVRKGYKTWQSSSRISILSPNSIEDLYKQRGRWFNGLIHDVNNSVLSMKIIVWIRLISWMLGIFGSWAFSPLWILFDPFWYAIPGGIMYWYMYIYGVKKLGSWRFLLLIPIYGILESFSWVKGVRCKEYVVIDKNYIRLRTR